MTKSGESDALARAMQAHQAGRLDEAAAGYERVLRQRPDDPDALHFYGLLHFHRREDIKAVELIMRSLAGAPANPHAWNNLGNVLITQDKIPEAKEAWRRATVLAPALPDAWYNLAVCLRDEGQFDQATRHFESAITHQPGFVRAHESLARLHYRLGRFAQAAKVYRQWSALDPANPIARHMAAATSGLDVPERADDEYIAKLFDKFAASFDHNLRQLGYRAPELVSSVLAQQAAASEGSLDVLDAGCGTGLCGPLLRAFCRRLTGVDLSPRMIELARERGGYDELAVAELCEFMRSHAGRFDAVVSADTLVYFGALEEACEAAKRSLREDGLFVFTVEALQMDGAEPYRLQVHGRYAHREEYVRGALDQAGFEILQFGRETLRMERLQEVIGYLIVARAGQRERRDAD